jgi:signal transduction histidine kinase
MRSLATKMSLWLAILFVVAFVIVGAIATQNTLVEERSLVQNAQQTQGFAAGTDVQQFYDQNRTLAGVQSVLVRDAQREGRGLVLLDASGRLVASSDPSLTRADVIRGERSFTTLDLRYETTGSVRIERLKVSQPLALIRSKRGTIAHLYPLPHPTIGGQSLAAFNQRFLIALAVVALLTLVCGYLLAQYLLDPIRKLTRATEQLRRGTYEKLNAGRSDELGDLARTFNALTAELEAASRQRRELIADIAHELRSPLTNIRCAIEEMQDGNVPATEAELASVHEEVMQLQHLIADLHDLSMADAHALHLEMQPVELKKAVAAAIQSFAKQFELKDLHVTTEVPQADLVVSADATRLRQIVANLLTNAIRATPDRGRISISLTRDRAAASVSVQDSGDGFNPAHAELIFERFFREERSRSRETGGSGLGLALTRQLVLAHAGTIRAENTGSGARFTLTLPLANAAATAESVMV